MEISKALIKTTILTLDALFKASEADIRLHDVGNIPKDQPVLFLLNHFTRLETTFFPYILYKQTGKYSLSLAHHSFFGGKFGKIMEKIGAVSTNNPDRDKLFISNMLTGKLYTIIFPEGQMIKDKKIIEKGKFMVYNVGIRRPPHTGAARLALRAQFYREKIKECMDKGRKNELDTIKDYFGFSDDDIKTITEKDTFIVPCNITYYPIRAKNNAIKKLVEKFTKNISFRFEEELEVEGTIIMEGVDIDINFGKPISVCDYMYRSKDMVKKISDDQLYLQKTEAKKELPLRKIRALDVAVVSCPPPRLLPSAILLSTTG
jgi:1-acyl-sn-glycerol-3-phosphate acyltransferase